MASIVGLQEAPAHKPYVSPSTILPEFTPRAVIIGVLFGLIFGASTVYLGLKVGLTVSASIPIAVLSITMLRLLGRASILENNIVQTTGSAGESIAAGIVFTIPALLILGLDLDILRTSLIGLTGGLLGVLLSSGLIAGGAIGGLVVAFGRVFAETAKNAPGKGEEILGIGGHSPITSGPWANVFALIIFAGLALYLFNVARKRSDVAKE